MPEIAVVGVERASKARPVALCPSQPRRHSNEYEPSASFRVADSLEVGRFCELPNQTGIAKNWSLEMWYDSGSVYRACILRIWHSGEPDYKELRAVHLCSDPRPKRNTSEIGIQIKHILATRWALIRDVSSLLGWTRLFLSDNKPWFSSGIPTAGIAGLMRREGLLLMTDMSIHAGVQCAKCSRVHFPATLKHIPEATIAVYQITCPPPCGAVT